MHYFNMGIIPSKSDCWTTKECVTQLPIVQENGMSCRWNELI